MAKRGSTKARSPFRYIILYIVFPLIAINAYAYWQLSRTAEHWALSSIPNSISETLTQLAVILGVNNAVIVFLLIYISLKRKKR